MSEKTYSLEITIQSLLEHKRYPTIKDILVTLNAADIAAIFAELSPEALPRYSVRKPFLRPCLKAP